MVTVKLPVPVPLEIDVSVMVGFAEVPQQIPLAVIELPPSLVTWAKIVAFFSEILLAESVNTSGTLITGGVGSGGFFLHCVSKQVATKSVKHTFKFNFFIANTSIY